MERVQERMTLKHKNTSRWVKHALTQKNNKGLQQAVSEQLARGEELRRKQNDISIPRGSSEDDSSAADDSDEDEGEEPRGLLSRLKSEEDPEIPNPNPNPNSSPSPNPKPYPEP